MDSTCFKDTKLASPYTKRVVEYGNNSFYASMKGKFPAATWWMTEVIKKISKDSQGKIELIYAAKAFTKHVINIKPKT